MCSFQKSAAIIIIIKLKDYDLTNIIVNLLAYKKVVSNGKKELPYFKACYVQNAEHKINRGNGGMVREIVSFPKYVAQKRNHLRYSIWKIGRQLENKYSNCEGLTEDEREKVDDILDGISELINQKSWNKNTLLIKQKEKL